MEARGAPQLQICPQWVALSGGYHTSMVRRSPRRRPLHVATILTGACHHAFELGAGVGLVFQPEIGLGGAALLWSAAFPAGVVAARRGGRWADGLLAACIGANLAAAVVHFTVWPFDFRPLPVLTAAEGLPGALLGPYNAVLLTWLGAGLATVAAEVPAGRRRWAAAGFVLALPFRRSLCHHLAWLRVQARTHPTWWSRALREPAVPDRLTPARVG